MSKHNKKNTPDCVETEELVEEQAPAKQEKQSCQTPEVSETSTQPDYREQYVRLYAEFDNYRKRTEREKAALIAYGKRDFALKLLPMYEVLLRQQKILQSKQAQDPKALQDGMRMILMELNKAFAAENIQKMDVLKKPYNPATQEVVATIPAPKTEDGLVIDEVKMGFMMDGQVLRPASVVVGQTKEEQ